jgi:hypothetical protein
VRTYGRIVPNPLYPDVKQWVVITTDANGFNDMVMLTTLIQVVKLNLGESPFFSNYGIPAHPSVVSQIAPDLFLSRIQQQFAIYFLSITLTKQPNALDEDGRPAPSYLISVITQYGAKLTAVVPY